MMEDSPYASLCAMCCYMKEDLPMKFIRVSGMIDRSQNRIGYIWRSRVLFGQQWREQAHFSALGLDYETIKTKNNHSLLLKSNNAYPSDHWKQIHPYKLSLDNCRHKAPLQGHNSPQLPLLLDGQRHL